MKIGIDHSSRKAEADALQLLGLACIGVAALIASLGLIGWTTGWNVLTSLRPDLIPLAPSSSIAFLVVAALFISR